MYDLIVVFFWSPTFTKFDMTEVQKVQNASRNEFLTLLERSTSILTSNELIFKIIGWIGKWFV